MLRLSNEGCLYSHLNQVWADAYSDIGSLYTVKRIERY